MSRREPETFETRRFPIAVHNNGPKHYGPDRLVPTTKIIPLADISYPAAKPLSNGSFGQLQTGVETVDIGPDGYSIVIYQVNGMQAVQSEPLLPFGTNDHGGGRTFGGGTSKDAIRRAKRNERKIRENSHYS